MGAVQQVDNILSGIGFAQARKDARHTVSVSVGVQVGHGVDGEDNIETAFVGLTCGRFHAKAGGDSGKNDLRYTQTFQVGFELSIGEPAPRPLGDSVIRRLLIQFRNELGIQGSAQSNTRRASKTARILAERFRGEIPGPERLFRSPGSTTGDVDQNHRLLVAAKGIGQGAGVLEDLFDRMHRRIGDDAFLQVDDDESGLRVDDGDGHSALQTTTSVRSRHAIPPRVLRDSDAGVASAGKGIGSNLNSESITLPLVHQSEPYLWIAAVRQNSRAGNLTFVSKDHFFEVDPVRDIP